MIVYKFKTKVVKIEHKNRLVRASKVGDEIKTTYEDLGWWVHMDGNFASLFVGNTEPDLVEGDDIKVLIKRLDPMT